MSDQQKMMGLQMLQAKQMQQGNPGILGALEGRYTAPTGAGYQYYQGGPTAPPFNPLALQAMLQQSMQPQTQQAPFSQSGVGFKPGQRPNVFGLQRTNY